jgi:hypothetical protein
MFRATGAFAKTIRIANRFDPCTLQKDRGLKCTVTSRAFFTGYTVGVPPEKLFLLRFSAAD